VASTFEPAIPIPSSADGCDGRSSILTDAVASYTGVVRAVIIEAAMVAAIALAITSTA
jgi:hypothetical protein